VKWTPCDIPALRFAQGPGVESSSGRGQSITKVIGSSKEGAVDSVLARLRLDYTILRSLRLGLIISNYPMRLAVNKAFGLFDQSCYSPQILQEPLLLHRE